MTSRFVPRQFPSPAADTDSTIHLAKIAPVLLQKVGRVAPSALATISASSGIAGLG